MTEVQMIFLNAMRSHNGAKLKISQVGFLPNENTRGWTRVDDYVKITRERAVSINLGLVFSLITSLHKLFKEVFFLFWFFSFF